MEFHSRDAIGKAGERLVETFIEENLNFIYRRTNSTDIGIDGDIEILDENRNSTGGFIKVQVKTTKYSLVGKNIQIFFDEKHLDYFSSLTVPPILSIVSLADKRIWWKPILHKENYRGPKGGFGIKLDPISDELTEKSRYILQMIGQRSNAIIAKYLLEEVEQYLDNIDKMENEIEYDQITLEFWAQNISYIKIMMREAKCLLKYERRYSDEISITEDKFTMLIYRIDSRERWFGNKGYGHLLENKYYTDDY